MHENLGPGDGNGLLHIAKALSQQGAMRKPGASPEAQKAADAQVYFLSEPESFAPLAAMGNPMELQVWSEGSSVPAKVSTTGIPRPGDIKDVSLRAEQGIFTQEGSRILLMHDGHVIGIGVVSATSAF